MSAARVFLLFCFTSLLCSGVSSVRAQHGVLGVFFDERGNECSGSIPPGSSKTLYVVLDPSGSTRGGIHGAEFRLDVSRAPSYLFLGESVLHDAAYVGSATGSGVTLGFPECQNGTAISILSLQVMNPGSGAENASILVDQKQPASNYEFECPLAVQCDDPSFTTICVSAGQVVLNPTREVSCRAGTEPAEWSGIKTLFRR